MTSRRRTTITRRFRKLMMLIFKVVLILLFLLAHHHHHHHHHHTPVLALSLGGSVIVPSLSSLSSTDTRNVGGDDHHWAAAQARLAQPECCVVSISGLETHFKVLQEHLVVGAGGAATTTFADVDLRARVRLQSSSSNQTTTTTTTTYNDCLEICRAVRKQVKEATVMVQTDDDACALALQELARGVASMDPSLLLLSSDYASNMINKDVFIRIVCASTYQARDPPFHTDKAPLRGYVTLCGPGTDYMVRCCSSPLEYLALRTGMGTTTSSSSCSTNTSSSLRRCPPLEFIVMKGDYYYSHQHHHDQSPLTGTAVAMNKIWQRTFACVHRSPPSTSSVAGRRVIISLDLADGDDDREWCVVNKRREWRNGLTQRKSRLVA
jgi:Protein of unknown function (DUF1826)